MITATIHRAGSFFYWTIDGQHAGRLARAARCAALEKCVKELQDELHSKRIFKYKIIYDTAGENK